MKEKATSFDIAHAAGVSQSTVSRALSNSPLVNQETRERIQRIAKELNYKVDKNASNLRKQRSNTIALLLFEDPTSDDSMINPFFLSMLGSITRACANAGYDLLVSFQNMNDDWHAEYEDSNKADGIILLGYGDYREYQEKLDKLEQQGTHFVRWGALDEEHPGISIGCDNYQGGADITNHLIELGAKSFAFVGEAGNQAPEFQARFNGFADALSKSAAHSLGQFDAISTEKAGYDACEALITLQKSANATMPDAIVCASDLIALGVMQKLADEGLSVPNDVAVVGYDNIPVAAYSTPTLTTVQQNTRKAGELLVSTLLDSISNKPVSEYLMRAELVVRQSCGNESTVK
jgi:DNA-binding LacI/PurR family transcriptional regulator